VLRCFVLCRVSLSCLFALHHVLSCLVLYSRTNPFEQQEAAKSAQGLALCLSFVDVFVLVFHLSPNLNLNHNPDTNPNSNPNPSPNPNPNHNPNPNPNPFVNVFVLVFALVFGAEGLFLKSSKLFVFYFFCLWLSSSFLCPRLYLYDNLILPVCSLPFGLSFDLSSPWCRLEKGP
jgi:hypothetical protein